MSAEEPQIRDTPEVVKKPTPQEWMPPPKMEATALSVLPNSKIPKENLEAFYDYCKENPQAKEAVDTVIKAFSPDSIGEFIKNCKQIPLPTDANSYEAFCLEYETQLRNVQEAPKVESSDGRTKWNELAKEQTDGKISKERQTILDVLTPWIQGKGYPDLLKKYGEFFKDSQSYPADSAEFRQAINGLLKELVLDAQKTGDGKDALQVAKAAYAMNAISDVDYARLSRELAELQAPRALDKAGGWASKTDLPAGFHQMTTKAGDGDAEESDATVSLSCHSVKRYFF